MGFSNVLVFLVLTFSVISMLAFIMHNEHTNTIERYQEFSVQEKRISEMLNTNIEILNVSYNDITYETKFLIENTGKEKLLPEDINLFLNNERLEKKEFRHKILSEVNLVNNPNHWDPAEILEILFEFELKKQDNYFTITVNNGVKDSIILYHKKWNT